MLKLLNAEKARTYGLPQTNITETDALAWLASLGAGAQAHLDSAIEAGAFARTRSDRPVDPSNLATTDDVNEEEVTPVAHALNTRKNKGG